MSYSNFYEILKYIVNFIFLKNNLCVQNHNRDSTI